MDWYDGYALPAFKAFSTAVPSSTSSPPHIDGMLVGCPSFKRGSVTVIDTSVE